MKRTLLIILSISLVFAFTACTTQNDKVLRSLGKYTKICFETHGGTQDYTDYAKYQFESPALEDNPYLKKIDDSSLASFKNHLDVYEPFIYNYCFDIHYDFVRGFISDTDYIYIYDDPSYPEYGNYSIWFYDFETNILYYFHSNT